MNDVGDAFSFLNRTIEKYVPDLPAGYTWGEAMERLKGFGVQVNWQKVESTLSGYEAFRYGGREMPQGTGDEVVLLSTQIRRRLIGLRNKAKSAE